MAGYDVWYGRGGSRQAEGTGESGFHGEVGVVMWMCGLQWQGSEGCGGRGQRGLMHPGALRSPTSWKKLVESPPGHVAWTLPWSRVRDSGNQESVTTRWV